MREHLALTASTAALLGSLNTALVRATTEPSTELVRSLERNAIDRLWIEPLALGRSLVRQVLLAAQQSTARIVLVGPSKPAFASIAFEAEASTPVDVLLIDSLQAGSTMKSLRTVALALTHRDDIDGALRRLEMPRSLLDRHLRQQGLISSWRISRIMKLVDATQLLLSSDKTLDEIASSAGMRSTRQLISAIRAITGSTASKLRRSTSEEELVTPITQYLGLRSESAS